MSTSTSRPPPPPLSDRTRRGGFYFIGGWILFVAWVSGLWAYRGEPGIVWDEPPGFERQDAILQWFDDLWIGNHSLVEMAGRARLEQAWRFCRSAPDEHGPVHAVLGVVGNLALRGVLPPIAARRSATVLLFGLACGILFAWVWRRWGWVPAWLAWGSLAFNPRIVSHAQFATLDAALGSLWFLAALAYLDSCESGRGIKRFGVLAALTILTKAMGVLVLPATLLFALIARPPRRWRPLLWSAILVPVLLIVLMPTWWTRPIAGPFQWADGILHYPQKIPVYFWGAVYDSRKTFLPWYNAPVLLAVMVPVEWLALGLVGLWIAIARSRRRKVAGSPMPTNDGLLDDHTVGIWAAIHFLTLPVLRGLSFMPGHDGLRQLVPSFFFLAVLVALGSKTVLDWIASRYPVGNGRSGWRATVGAALLLLASASITARFQPHGLAYYSPIIGGPWGAQRLGFESTYYWDSATRDVLDWINQNLPPGATLVAAPPPDVRVLGWYQRLGMLRGDLVCLSLEKTRPTVGPVYVIAQMRQGLMLPRVPGQPAPFGLDGLINAPARYELRPPAVGVRLLAIFDEHDLASALAAPSH